MNDLRVVLRCEAKFTFVFSELIKFEVKIWKNSPVCENISIIGLKFADSHNTCLAITKLKVLIEVTTFYLHSLNWKSIVFHDWVNRNFRKKLFSVHLLRQHRWLHLNDPRFKITDQSIKNKKWNIKILLLRVIPWVLLLRVMTQPYFL